MQEVTCFNCHNRVHITPDTDRCTVCGEDLRGLLEPASVSRYFSQRAVELAGQGKLESALAEVKRGLAYADQPDLRLLGAILSEQMGRYDMMRGHVAAIPIDDPLRAEAEWLLRSHQNRQAALREGLKYGRPKPATASATLAGIGILGAPEKPPKRSSRPVWIWSAVAAALILALAYSGWFIMRYGGDMLAALLPTPGPIAPAKAAAPLDASQTAASPSQTAPAPTSQAPQPTITAALASPPPSPGPTAAHDLVLTATQTPALAAGNVREAVLVPAAQFNLRQFLLDRGYPELADLPIEARLQNGTLILQGIVYMDLQRRELLGLLQQDPGIRDVNAVDLRLRPKPAYTVQEGDTIWTIVADIYGDASRLEEFTAANLDVAPEPSLLRVGDVLEVPPIE